jgi:hypothetical protein
MEPEGEGDRVNLRGKTFTWRGQTLPYETGAYNNAGKNERAVEVPIARAWLETVSGVGLEVGNVLGHYEGAPERTVVDLWEKAVGVRNVDLFDVTERYDWVLAISTVEHVRHDAPPAHPLGGVDAIAHLRSLLNPGGRMLVTVPFGHNDGLDAAILLGHFASYEAVNFGGVACRSGTTGSTMVRDKNGTWSEEPGAHWEPYGTVTIWANAVWIATFDA